MSILDGAPSSVPGAPSSVPGNDGSMMSGFIPTGGSWHESAGEFRDAHFRQVRDANGRFAGGWGFAWQGLESTAEHIRAFNDRLHADLKQVAQELCDEMVEYAKENAPWQDHPGVHEDARENLQGGVIWDGPEKFTIYLGHGANVFYGIWLEVRWGGRFAIIVPTIMQFAPQLGGRLKGAR